MSLILDALRKSEAERRRGQAPDLFAATVPAPGTARPRRIAGLALATLAVLALVAVFYWRGPDSAPAATVGPRAGVALEAEPTRQDAQDVTAVPPAKPPVVEALPPPVPVTNLALPAPASPPAFTTPAPAPAIAKDPSPASPPAPAAPIQMPSPVALAQPDESLPPLAILSAAERAALPPMKLSMHVWNSDAGKRFAIVDGQRISEGSLLGGSVVEEIRRDGVVLNINGRRVLLSRP